MSDQISMRSDGIYKTVSLHPAEITLLRILQYLQDKEDGCGEEEHFNNIMMDDFYVQPVVEKLLEKVGHNYDAISYVVKVG